MAQVLLAAPTVETVRLTEALRRLLLRRGHRVRTVVLDPVTNRCAQTQLCEASLQAPDAGTCGSSDAPVDYHDGRDTGREPGEERSHG